MIIVIDASVAAKWFFQEEHSVAALISWTIILSLTSLISFFWR